MQRFVRRFVYSVAAVVLSMVAWSDAVAVVTIEVIPPNPRYLEPVVVRLKSPIVFGSVVVFYARASMSGNVINVEYRGEVDLGGSSFDLDIGRFPEGTYTVRAQGGLQDPATVQFTVSAAPDPFVTHIERPMVNYSGLWWTPSESGWGLTIVQGPTDVLFAAWFTFDREGKPVWYTLQPGQWSFGGSYTGPIYKATGPFYGANFDPSAVGVTQVGTGTLDFRRHFNTGAFRYTVEGISGAKSIERFVVD